MCFGVANHCNSTEEEQCLDTKLEHDIHQLKANEDKKVFRSGAPL